MVIIVLHLQLLTTSFITHWKVYTQKTWEMYFVVCSICGHSAHCARTGTTEQCMTATTWSHCHHSHTHQSYLATVEPGPTAAVCQAFSTFAFPCFATVPQTNIEVSNHCCWLVDCHKKSTAFSSRLPGVHGKCLWTGCSTGDQVASVGVCHWCHCDQVQVQHSRSGPGHMWSEQSDNAAQYFLSVTMTCDTPQFVVMFCTGLNNAGNINEICLDFKQMEPLNTGWKLFVSSPPYKSFQQK